MQTPDQQLTVVDKYGNPVNTTSKPSLFNTRIDNTYISRIFSLVRMNHRQPYGVNPEAGKQHSAEGWGTGRAVARVPRVKGSGMRRAGQAAFANFARKGRMAHPTKVTRKWHRKINELEKMRAIAMCYAASSQSMFVQSRGHQVEGIKQLPIIVDDLQAEKTKAAMDILTNLGLKDEVNRVRDSKKKRPGMGKMRNRKYRKARGILIINTGEEMRGFRNIPGVEIMNVNEPCLEKLAPGGHAGRLLIWTKEAVEGIFDFFNKRTNYREVENLSREENLDALFYAPCVQAVLERKEFKGEMALNRDVAFCAALN